MCSSLEITWSYHVSSRKNILNESYHSNYVLFNQKDTIRNIFIKILMHPNCGINDCIDRMCFISLLQTVIEYCTIPEKEELLVKGNQVHFLRIPSTRS